jgi:hypothetical protein
MKMQDAKHKSLLLVFVAGSPNELTQSGFQACCNLFWLKAHHVS